MRDLIAAEWLKLRALPSTRWTLALTALVLVAAAAFAAHTKSPTDEYGLSDGFPLAGYLALIIVATSFGATTMITEHSSGLIRATAVAVPARAELVLAKAAVLAALWTVAGAIMAFAGFTVSGLILGDVSFALPGTVPALLAATLIAPVCALVGLGLAVLLRHGGTVYVCGILLLVLAPQLAGTHQEATRAVNHAMLVPAWQRLTQSYGPPSAVGDIYATATQAWLAYALWPLLLLLAAVLVFRRRDV
ncbi:ABC transporter permease [Actinoplanes sp. NPDC024001]|uniref:ABC transporter permease n=1 Tax=Actinoplanes sp. NPDC024001 TaxID=3154598 RepID=UPI0033F69CEB